MSALRLWSVFAVAALSRSTIARWQEATDPQSPEGGSQRACHTKGAHSTASGRLEGLASNEQTALLWQVGSGLFGLPAQGPSRPTFNACQEVSHSVGAADDWSPRVPASVSSSELSAHQMAPSGVLQR